MSEFVRITKRTFVNSTLYDPGAEIYIDPKKFSSETMEKIAPATSTKPAAPPKPSGHAGDGNVPKPDPKAKPDLKAKSKDTEGI